MSKRSIYIRIYLVIMVFLYACTKSNDASDDASTYIFAAHYAPGAGLISGTVANQPLVGAGINYGQVTGGNEPKFERIGSGVEKMEWMHQNKAFLDGNVSFGRGEYYSFIFADETSNNNPSWYWIKEDTTTIDSMASMRWLPLVPNNDTLSAVLINSTDTIVVAVNRFFDRSFLNRPEPLSAPFQIRTKPGTYRVEVYKNNRLIYTKAALRFNRQSLYTLCWAYPNATARTGEVIIWKNK
jgi:hypothetical protein